MALRHRLGMVPIGTQTPTTPVERAVARSQLDHSQIDLLIDLEYLAPDSNMTHGGCSAPSKSWRRWVCGGESC